MSVSCLEISLLSDDRGKAIEDDGKEEREMERKEEAKEEEWEKH